MPGIDWIPGVSQVKSLAQAITGDFEGAARTAENFARECPVVSQVTSVVQLATGDTDGAIETQKKCLGTVNNVANGIPVVGHVKGLGHHLMGDHEGGNQALNAATRSTVVIGSGAVAAVASGGVAAIPAGITAGAAYDAAASTVTGDDHGYVAAMKNVAKNPSAGTIIDAIAIPVGDGLAGYSGGQVANKIQVHNLKGLRISKLDQMDAAATSAERMAFASEAMEITAKINTIEHGTPYVFNDPKTGTIAAEASSTTPVAVPGYVNDPDKDQGSSSVLGGIAAAVSASLVVVEQEDALDYDSYVKVYQTTEATRKDAQKSLHRSDQSKAQGNILATYQQVRFTTRKNLSDLLGSSGQEPNREPRRLREILNQLFKWAWLRLVMPTEFPYSVVAQVNSHFGGLYHSFIRHMDQWAQVIPTELAPLIRRLEPIVPHINRSTAADTREDAERARTDLIAARNALSRERFNDVQSAMVEIQLAMHNFIQENITYENYQGRSLNTDGQERLYFKVETAAGTQVMVLCLSKQKFEPETGDSRPIRILMTVFFESWNDFRSHGLLETRNEMDERRDRQ